MVQPNHPILEGTWEDLIATHPDLRGHRVRVIVVDENIPAARNLWLESLREWSASHPPLSHEIDVSREAMYSGTLDDPR